MHIIWMLLIVKPIRFLFYPFSKWILKPELENDMRIIKNYDKWNKEKKQKIDSLESICNKYKNADENIHDITSHFKTNYITTTKTGEPVIISHNSDKLDCCDLILNKIYDNKYDIFCSKLGTHHWETSKILNQLKKAGVDIEISQTISLCDICSKEKRKGYASTLLQMLFKLSSEKGFRYIVGWLSSVDRKDHQDLKIFYESLGFQVYMIKSDEGVIVKYL